MEQNVQVLNNGNNIPELGAVKAVKHKARRTKSILKKGVKKVSNNWNEASTLSLDDMNDDCLMTVFEYLDTISLVRVSKTSERFKRIVTQRMIPMKMVRFSELRGVASIEKTFALFGKSMTRISIGASDIQMTHPMRSRFAELLHLLIKYCTPGKLQQLYLNGFGDGNTKTSQELWNDVQPYLENIHTLYINLPFIQGNFLNTLLNIIPKTKLQHLHLHKVGIIGDWLRAENLPNLQEFHICMACNHFVPNDTNNLNKLKAYMADKPKLTSFSYSGKSQEALLIELSRHIPNINQIGTVLNSMFEQNDVNNNNNWDDQSYRQKWKYLDAFTNLKQFSLQSFAPNFGNCGEIFRILASQNTIERLELISGYTFSNGGSPVQVTDLRQLTNVKSLILENFNRSKSDIFVDQLFEHLTQLKECTFSGDGTMLQSRVVNLIRLAVNLRVLNIQCKISSFSVRFYKTLIKTRIAAQQHLNQPLTICVDEDIFNYFKTELTTRSYKPAIITIKPLISQASFQLI